MESDKEIREIIPVPLRRVRTTRSSTHSHSFQVSLPTSRTLSHKSSFIPRTCSLWDVLPSSCFPDSYNFLSFKSKINKIDLKSNTLMFEKWRSYIKRDIEVLTALRDVDKDTPFKVQHAMFSTYKHLPMKKTFVHLSCRN